MSLKGKYRFFGRYFPLITVTVNSDTPTLSCFLPLYYTKTLGGSINGQKKIYNETGAGTTYEILIEIGACKLHVPEALGIKFMKQAIKTVGESNVPIQ